jgi:MraZ protein
MRGIILTQGTPDHCIRAYPLDEFEKTAANYMSEPITTPTGRVMRRNFFSGAYQAEMDRNGRVLVPPVLRQFAGLDSQVVVLGAGDAIELWNAATYDAAMQEEAGEYRQSLGSE